MSLERGRLCPLRFQLLKQKILSRYATLIALASMLTVLTASVSWAVPTKTKSLGSCRNHLLEIIQTQESNITLKLRNKTRRWSCSDSAEVRHVLAVKTRKIRIRGFSRLTNPRSWGEPMKMKMTTMLELKGPHGTCQAKSWLGNASMPSRKTKVSQISICARRSRCLWCMSSTRTVCKRKLRTPFKSSSPHSAT